MPGALPFDMDGALIDSQPRWHDEMRVFARRLGIEWTAERMRERDVTTEAASVM